MARRRRARTDTAGRLTLPALLLVLAGCAAQVPAPPAAVPVLAAALSADELDFRLVLAEAEAGDPNAQLLLAEKFLAGDGTPHDAAQAHAWLDKAAAREYAPAQDLLSTLHYRGIGVAVDFHKALALMERAAAHRYLPAINNLAWFLATCPDDSVRDGKRAVALLEPVMDQSAQMQDTLAAAYAEAGDFSRAEVLQNQAIIALGSADDPRLTPFIERLDHYARGLPWRDPPASRSGAPGP